MKIEGLENVSFEWTNDEPDLEALIQENKRISKKLKEAILEFNEKYIEEE